MCDPGRYGWKYVHDADRLHQTTLRVDAAAEGGAKEEVVEHHQVADALRRRLEQGQLTLAISPFMTVEEAYLAAKYARSVDPEARLAMGPVPTEGEDESFANGFTIHAEKCPNRRGVQMVLDSCGDWLSWDELLEVNAESPRGALWILGGYPAAWSDASIIDKLPSDQPVILHDLFPSDVSQRAQMVIPEAAFAERDGSFVNVHDRLQSFGFAIRPPAGVVPAGRLLWALSGRQGLYNAKLVLQDAAREIVLLSNAVGEVPATGVDLRGNLLA